jgi:hypothetical protein
VQSGALTADTLGNFHFYAPTSTAPYTVQIYGPSVAAPYVSTDQLVLVNVFPSTVTATAFLSPANTPALYTAGACSLSTNCTATLQSSPNALGGGNSNGLDVIVKAANAIGVGSGGNIQLNVGNQAGGGTQGVIKASGVFGQYNAINTVSNGIPSEYATVDLLAQTANIGSTTLYAVPALGAGLYRVSCYAIVTSVGTTSTLPTCTIGWTDKDNSTVQTLNLTATSTGNALTTFTQGTMVLDGKASTNITYSTTGYASSGSAMQYAIHIKVEAL